MVPQSSPGGDVRDVATFSLSRQEQHMEPTQPVYEQQSQSVYEEQPGQPVQPVQPVASGQRVERVNRTYSAGGYYWPNNPADRAIRVVYLVLGIVEALLAIRVVLKLLAANPGAGFSSFIYGITAPFVAPFQGVFPDPATNGSVLEVSALLAMVVWALVAWIIVRIIDMLRQRQPTPTA
jgi:uncharacterized protein YggT (Ycf19 family)